MNLLDKGVRAVNASTDTKPAPFDAQERQTAWRLAHDVDPEPFFGSPAPRGISVAIRHIRWMLKTQWNDFFVLRHHNSYLDKLDGRATLVLRQPAHGWQPFPRASTMTGPRAFRFQEIEHALPDSRGWRHMPWGETWLSQLHRLDDLVADGASARSGWHRSLVVEWMRVNRPGRGVGWTSQCLAPRIVNLIKWDLAYGVLREELATRHLIVQTRYLREHFASHSRDGSAIEVAKALVFAGCFFAECRETARWRRKGLNALRVSGNTITHEDLQDLIQLDAVYPGVLPFADVSLWRQRLAQGTRPN